MNAPPSGQYLRPPSISLGYLTDGWRLFLRAPVVWVGATGLWGILAGGIFTLSARWTGVWAMCETIFRTQVNVDATNADGSWPPYGSLWAEAAWSVLFLLINWVVSILSLAGLCRLALLQIRGRPVRIVDAFAIGRRLAPLTVLGLVTFLPIVVSLSLCIGPACVVAGVWMFAPILVEDGGLNPVVALRRSACLIGAEWIPAVIFVLVGVLFAYAGSLLFVVGTVLTYPGAVIALGMAYERSGVTTVPVPQYAQTPGEWPPAPDRTGERQA